MKIDSFKANDWVKIWEGGWSFLSCSDFGYQYTKGIRFGRRPFAPQSIIFIRKGHSEGWMRQRDRDVLGNYLSGEVINNPKIVKQVSSELKKQAKDILRFIDSNENTVASLALYNEFWDRVMIYYKPHINVKYVVDYLDPSLLKKHLKDLQDARLAAESVLNRTEDFMVSFAKLLSKKSKTNYKLLLCMTRKEMGGFPSSNKMPKKSELQKRFAKSVFLHESGKPILFTGRLVGQIEKLVHPKITESVVKGSVAFAGKAVGIARIVFDPHKVKVFNKGDVLIAGSTRPEFLPLMHKASAFVTDAGGILSHAAIVARELKKPCVIGTLIATKVFKDGDKVEVDATQGTVRKI